jgi:signal transduction histidine kinase
MRRHMTGRTLALTAAVATIGLAVAALCNEPGSSTPPVPIADRVFGGILAAGAAAWSVRWPRTGVVVGLVAVAGLASWHLGFASPLVYLTAFVMYQSLAHSDMKRGVAVGLSLVALLAGPAAMALRADSPGGEFDVVSAALVDVTLVCLLVWVAAGQLRAERRANAAMSALRAAEQSALIAAERRRIAAELHDVAGHHLAAMAVETKVALRLGDVGSLRAAAESVADGAVESLNAMRRLAHLLHQAGSAPLEPAGSIRKLDELRRRVESAGLGLRVRSPQDWPAIDSAVDGACYRIVQEALTNAIKHSDATSADIEVTIEDDHDIVVRVANDTSDTNHADPTTKGIDDWQSGEAPGWVGHGLVGMQERARACGGSFRAGRIDGRWLVEARMPVGPQ